MYAESSHFLSVHGKTDNGTGVFGDGVGSGKLTRTEELVLGAVNGSRTVNEVIKESAVGSFDAIKTIYQFLQSRVLRIRTA